MIHDPELATAADYADAMLTARRAKNWLMLLLLLILLGQLAIFFVVRYDVVPMNSTAAATIPSTEPAATPAPSFNWADAMQYLCAGCVGMGLVLNILLSLVLLLIVNIMLVGRLIGVGRLTGAYCWCLVLLVLLFPWQVFFGNVGLGQDPASWKWPGVLYTWGELSQPIHGAHFAGDLSKYAILKWTRFVAIPVLAVLILLAIQVKSNRGMRQALGEEEAPTPNP
ncbi:MAG TPA: hypothetical protein VHD56_14495 [Tepidisphaeraceae bacterium]|nr:hypothetical protein [Tepidisphaeraceae bacterium]